MPVLKFFLKSKNLKSLIISPNSHSTVTLTELISASLGLVCHDEMVLAGALAKGRQGRHIHTWPRQLEKMHFAQGRGGGWSPQAY